MPVLAVNVDHVATIRQARLANEPDPVHAAVLAELAGAAGVIVHLREDRRHIQDRDVDLLAHTVKTKLNLEMAATGEMQAIALRVRPASVCLVPEKRQELTTEGGLDLLGREEELSAFLAPLREAGVLSSLFIDAWPEQIEAAARIGADYVELHTGRYAEARRGPERLVELDRLLAGITQARGLGLKVNLGHGLDYHNILAFKSIPGVSEYSIGHSIIARSVLTGLLQAVREMADLVGSFAD